MQVKTIDPHPDPAKLFNDGITEPTKRFTLPVVEELGLEPDPEIEKMLKGDYPFLPKPVESYYADWERRLLKCRRGPQVINNREHKAQALNVGSANQEFAILGGGDDE